MLAPLIALLVLVLTWGRKPGTFVVVVVALVLGAAVLSAVHHAEIVAHRVGEPFGSLVLAVAVTVIEVALIVTLMVSGGPETSSLARDTVFAAVMITCNGIVGLALLIGGLRYSVTMFNAEGTGAALATIATLATLSLVLPTFTTSRPGPEFSPAQLTFAALASVILYGLFVLTQTVRHRDFFLPLTSAGEIVAAEEHADPPTSRAALASVGLLLAALVAVVGLAKVESPAIEAGIAATRVSPIFRWGGDCLARAAAGDPGGGPRGAPGPLADQPQSRLRLRNGQHRADHPDDRRGLHLVGGAVGSRP